MVCSAAAVVLLTTLLGAGLPHNTLVVAVNRAGATLFPRADTRLQASDVIMVMAEPRSEQALRTFLEGSSCLLPAPKPGENDRQ